MRAPEIAYFRAVRRAKVAAIQWTAINERVMP
jgi:hypothetical protein